MKYLFTAIFADGGHIQQTIEDVAVAVQPTPERPRPSAFSDVVEHPSKLICFILANEDHSDVWSLDLTTLDFSHNETLLRLHTARELPLTDVKLVYFRNAFKDIHVHQDGTTESGAGGIRSFHLGWSAKNAKGEEVTRFIEIW